MVVLDHSCSEEEEERFQCEQDTTALKASNLSALGRHWSVWFLFSRKKWSWIYGKVVRVRKILLCSIQVPPGCIFNALRLMVKGKQKLRHG